MLFRSQDCVDGDPRCDFDGASGACRLQLFTCVGGADARLGCPAAGIAGVDVLRPTIVDPGPLRDTLIAALAELGLPDGPGEVCTRGIPVDLPAGKKGIVLKLRTRLASGKQDRDALKLRCLPAPAP